MLHTPIHPWGKPVRHQRLNRFQKYSRNLPIQPHPAPVLQYDNPFSIFSFLYKLISEYLFPPSSHPKKLYQGYYDPATQSVHVTDETTLRALWEQGFFGKGSLSRSEPEWIEAEKRRLGLSGSSRAQTSADVTKKRREERREVKMERARLEAEAVKEQLRSEKGGTVGEANHGANHDTNTPLDEITVKFIGTFTSQQMSVDKASSEAQSHDPSTEAAKSQFSGNLRENMIIKTQEHLQLSAVEAFFLCYSLGVLEVLNLETNELYSTIDLFKLFCRVSNSPPTLKPEPDDPFLLSYVVYHHFRSLGWVVRPGMKFAVDYLLYHRGPVFAHAEFAVLILPSYNHSYWSSDELRKQKCEKRERREWWWLLGANRVQTQVRKTLVLVYVDIPPPYVVAAGGGDSIDIKDLLQHYRVREFVMKRWSPNRNRD